MSILLLNLNKSFIKKMGNLHLSNNKYAEHKATEILADDATPPGT